MRSRNDLQQEHVPVFFVGRADPTEQKIGVAADELLRV
jgi:hypothetical protein